jgi:hypothetical protein
LGCEKAFWNYQNLDHAYNSVQCATATMGNSRGSANADGVVAVKSSMRALALTLAVAVIGSRAEDPRIMIGEDRLLSIGSTFPIVEPHLTVSLSCLRGTARPKGTWLRSGGDPTVSPDTDLHGDKTPSKRTESSGGVLRDPSRDDGAQIVSGASRDYKSESDRSDNDHHSNGEPSETRNLVKARDCIRPNGPRAKRGSVNDPFEFMFCESTVNS